MNILKNISGSILIIGFLDEIYLSDNITEVFYMNSNNSYNKGYSDNSIFVAKNIHIKNLHKHFKKGIDNIYVDYDEIKKYYPSFIRESLKITKKEIYINLKHKEEYDFILEKYKRFNIDIIKYEYKDYFLMKIIVKKNNFIKRYYYFFLDSIEKIYNMISDNI